MTLKLNKRIVLGGLATLQACRDSTSKLDAESLHARSPKLGDKRATLYAGFYKSI